MAEEFISTESARIQFPLLGEKNFAPWRLRMANHLKELDMWWIVSGHEEVPDKESTDPAIIRAYDKYLRKCFQITAKIRNAMEPQICSKYASKE